MGRRRPVEVPLRRLRRPVGRAARRRGRDPGLREPPLRAERAHPAPRRARLPRRSSTGSRARTKAGTIANSESSTRRATRATYTGKECLDWAGGRTGEGYAAQGNILVSAETVDAHGRDLRGKQRAAGGAPDRLPGRSPGRRRRQPRPAVLRAPRRPAGRRLREYVGRRSSSSASRTTSARSRSCAASTRFTTRSSGRRRASEWLDVDDELAAELRERLAKLGYEGDLEEAFTRWTGKENLEDRVDGIEQIDPVVLEALRSRT